MLAHLLDPANRPFTVALVVMAGIGLLEATSAFFGAGVSSLLDDLLGVGPDVDADVDLDGDAAVDADADGAHPEMPGPFTRLLGWLHVGKVPVLVLLVVFLLCFGLSGLFLQAALFGATGLMAPAWLAGPVVGLLVLPAVRGLGGIVARIMPKEETTAVSRASFVGRVATVTLGTATRGAPAQAKLRDRHGQVHYVLVEPDVESETFPTGTAVLLVSQRGVVFRAIQNPKPSLLG